MRLSIIAAIGSNKEIGLNGSIPWSLPSDLKHFRQLTTGHSVIMGRKTFESIGKPLPNRTNLVLSHNPDYKFPGCLVVPDLETARLQIPSTETETFIIGGAGLYTLGLLTATRMYLTEVDYSGPADVYFPMFDQGTWEITSTESPPPSPKDQYKFRFIIYDRRSNIQPW